MELWNKEKDQPNWGATIAAVIGVAIVLFGITFSIAAATFGLRVATAGLIGKGEAHIQTQSAEFRLYAYNHFFDVCAAVQANEGALDAQFESLTTATRDKDKARINANIAGIKAQRQANIATYNADALKWTRGQFRDSDLPYQLSSANYPEGGKTTCAVAY